MADRLVERLRALAAEHPEDYVPAAVSALLRETADEIERLTEELIDINHSNWSRLIQAEAKIDRLTKALQVIADTDEKDIHAQYYARKALVREGE